MASTEVMRVAPAFGDVRLDALVEEALDPVSEAAALGRIDKQTGRGRLKDALVEASELFDQACRDGGYRASLPRVLDLVIRHPDCVDLQITAARLLARDGDDRALGAWLGIHRRFPDAAEPFRAIVRTIVVDHGERPARAVLAGLRPQGSDPDGELESLRLAFGVDSLSDPASTESFGTEPSISLHAIEVAFADALRTRRARPPPGGRLGGVLMVTGSLGPGGAERQLTATALALQTAYASGQSIDGCRIDGPIAVASRSLAAKHDNNFFVGILASAGVAVTEYSRLPRFGGDERLASGRLGKPVLDFLPSKMREGVTRLAEFIRYEAPDVVQIWQDGMVLAAGLAALMAETPRVVLSVRTLPPIDRANRWRAELEPVYRALLSAPGVVITANSHVAARRYEAWLSMPAGSVRVIPNGVDLLPASPQVPDGEAWDVLCRRTPEANFTLGAVMRLDRNKRPLEWLMVADRVRRLRPHTRFVVVGDGPMRAEVRHYADRLGLSDCLMLTGRSASVGFWLSNMDALMLLSRYEGMPNVLIEAQLAGVPVVTTPAGGAAETLLPGETGFILPDAEVLDLDRAADRIVQLIDLEPIGRQIMSRRARRWAEETFSVKSMLAGTVEAFTAPHTAPILPATGA